MLTYSFEGRSLIVSGLTSRWLSLTRDAAGIITAQEMPPANPPDGVVFDRPDILDLDLRGLEGAWANAVLTLDAVAQQGILYGSGGDDRLSIVGDPTAGGPGGVIELWGFDGHDLLTGSNWGDLIRGGYGRDSLYGGAGDDTLAGDVGDDILDGGEGVDTALYLTNAAITVDLRRTDAQVTGLGRDQLIGIENVVTGGGADQLIGNDGDNLLDGGGGNDTLTGGLGNDTYVVSAAGDVLIELAGGGYDTALSQATFTLPDEVEALILTGTGNTNGTGNALDNRLTGNSGNNTLRGGLGADTLDGGAGGDRLDGGKGDDLYLVDADDLVLEFASEGFDTVRASVSFTLLANVEVLQLIGSANIAGYGNDLDNLILGNAGDNTLGGGAGVDTLIGGLGNDLYDADADDIIVESAGQGIDTLRAAGDAILPDNIEVLNLSGPGPLSGTGNGLDNLIIGGDDDDTLTGGAGRDTLMGGYGNDSFRLDAGDTGDLVIEGEGGGIDTIYCDFAMTLPDHVEDLVLGGTLAATLTGNALDNRITGNAADNVLIGGVGADTMDGGAGADIYHADGDDQVGEAGDDGAVDIVYCSGSIDLGGGIDVLVLTGTQATTGRGNALANRITGNAAANLLDGRGGLDTLIGGLGDDVYVTDGNALIIEDASAGSDTVMSSGTFRLGANIETLMLTGIANINGDGNDGDNVLLGNGGANLLRGEGGVDTLLGGPGNDTYVVDPGDVVGEAVDGGRDTIWSGNSYMLTANIEVLCLGGVLAVNGTGNTLNNLIIGNIAANVLDGRGGRDTLHGGGGNDLYLTDGLDVIVETAGGGLDTVRSTASFRLPDWVENLTAATATGVMLTGNALANRLTGNGGADTLVGLQGRDVLIGGRGDDRYYAEAGDAIVEAPGGGYDSVVARTTFVLPAQVEALILQGTDRIWGVGNDLNNRIVGNAAANRLEGRGGADTLEGGLGDDVYVADRLDTVIERPGQGRDTIISGTSITMPPEVEVLVLAGAAGFGVGNRMDNRMTGTAGANTLMGLEGNDTLLGGLGNDRLAGGRGNDALIGGAGADRFIFHAQDGRDTVWDFQNGLDKIEIGIGAERFADLNILQSGQHTVVQFAGTQVWLLNTRSDLIDPGDFVFV